MRIRNHSLSGVAAGLVAVAIVQVGCGGKSSDSSVRAPEISSFVATNAVADANGNLSVTSGTSPQLKAFFATTGGDARIGTTLIQSGVTIVMAPITADTDYTLTVTNSAGAKTTATISIKVVTQAVASVYVGTVAGAGMHSGPVAKAAEFNFNSTGAPAQDAAGNIYVADTNNHTIRKIGTDGSVSVLAGKVGVSGTTNALGTAAAFKTPRAVVADAKGNLYVADGGNALIRRIDSNGNVTTLAGSTSGNADHATNPLLAKFKSPTAFALDATANILYVADYANHNIRRVYLDPATGNATKVDTLAGSNAATAVSGKGDGVGTAASFLNPAGLALANGTLFVGDLGNSLIRTVTVADATVKTIAGGAAPINPPEGASNTTPIQFMDGQGAAAMFSSPAGLAVDANGTVYVADSKNNNIRKLTFDGTNWNVSTFCGATLPAFDPAVDPTSTTSPWGASAMKYSSPAYGTNDGAGNQAKFNTPYGLSLSSDGSKLLVVDSYSSVLRSVDLASAVAATVAGSVRTQANTEGLGTSARMKTPGAVVADANGSLIVVDGGNYQLRLINPQGFAQAWKITYPDPSTVTWPTSVANLTTPVQFSPKFAALDGQGGVYVLVQYNDAKYFSADATKLKTTANYQMVLLKVAANGATTRVFPAAGAASPFTNPSGLVVDKAGAFAYVADKGTTTPTATPKAIYQIDLTAGTVTPSATLANTPTALAIDAADALVWAEGASASNGFVKTSPTFAGIATPTILAGATDGAFGFRDGNVGAKAAATTGLLNGPTGLAIVSDATTGAAKTVYIAESGNHAIRRVDVASKAMTTIVGLSDGSTYGVPVLYGAKPGIGAGISLWQPQSVAVMPDGTLAVITNDGVMKVTPVLP